MEQHELKSIVEKINAAIQTSKNEVGKSTVARRSQGGSVSTRFS